MRIGTWNVEYATGAGKNARRRDVLQQHNCDVWVLTETHDELAPSVGHTAVHSDQRPTGRLGGRWTSIWTRYPVLQQLEVVDPRRTVAAVVEAPKGPLIVYGTVMPWHDDRGDAEPGTPVRNWSEMHRVVVQQGQEWAALRQQYPEADLCVAGDLNMNLGGKHYYGTAQSRQLLREAMAACGLFCATETERVPAGKLAHPPIDHVLLPAAWEPHAAAIAAWEGKTGQEPRLSDHSGLAVEVDLMAAPSPF
ncbi:endonuclease/exonuclease/phosphatase family protein [Methylobacterium brachiatum]|uniref:endonuclease/exonuclease/phosphatase family protein n=1 Tax=Methylobacterium brachiatum TaxID=269660 RepID=UPI0008ECC146|nr:endonuclease/exonuclease/phosphatase family protein [Methylobacterium brachiatum]SFI85281.1 Endonuclease/Exonuclease/phosphatase family protein [Methylobacterium brachiatum]